MPRIKEFVKDLKIAIPAMLDDDISDEESTEIISVIIKDKDIYEAFIAWTNNTECEKLTNEYNDILSAKIDDLHEKYWYG